MKFTEKNFLDGKVAIKGDGSQKLKDFLTRITEEIGWSGRSDWYKYNESSAFKVSHGYGIPDVPLVSIDDLVETLTYGGEIKDFPQEVVELMLKRQVEQGNKENVTVFEKGANKIIGGFSWAQSPEDYGFWNSVINKKNFNTFFDKYPKQTQTNMSQNIIGYKLKKEYAQMNDACKTITGYSTFDFITGLDSAGTPAIYNNESGHTDCYSKLKSANVLELWFESMCDDTPKYKVGDWVKIGPKADGWGAVHEEVNNKVLQITKIEGYNNCYKKEQGKYYFGSRISTVGIKIERLATADEIRAAQEQVVSVGGAFDVKVRGNQVFHETDNITQFVKEICTRFINNGMISGYVFYVSDIIFSKTGCQNKTTKLSDWKKIYDMIK